MFDDIILRYTCFNISFVVIEKWRKLLSMAYCVFSGVVAQSVRPFRN